MEAYIYSILTLDSGLLVSDFLPSILTPDS